MKQKSGISLASVIIATMLILLLTTTITISVNKVLDNANKMSFASEINTLQTSVNSYYLVNNEYPILSENIIMDISNVENKDVFSDEEIVDGKLIIYKIDYDKIDYVSLNYGTNLDSGDIYGISQATGKVYYAKGMKFSNITYFTLNDELKSLLIGNRNNNTKNNDLVKIIPSQTEWTNNSISVTVKVPKSYTNISVTSGIKSYYLNREEDDFYVYYMQEEGNYIVNVKAKDKRGNIKEATYKVENFDIQKPSIKIDNHIVLSDVYSSEIFGYYNILNTEDDLSGVKQVKYEYGKIDDNVYNYFKSNGEVVKDDKIMIKRGYEYITVYIEDNAKNYDVVYIKI